MKINFFFFASLLAAKEQNLNHKYKEMITHLFTWNTIKFQFKQNASAFSVW